MQNLLLNWSPFTTSIDVIHEDRTINYFLQVAVLSCGTEEQLYQGQRLNNSVSMCFGCDHKKILRLCTGEGSYQFHMQHKLFSFSI